MDAIATLNALAFYKNPADASAMVATWRRDRIVDGFETTWQGGDGGDRVVRLSGRLVVDDQTDEEQFEVFVEDVTERRRLEAEFRQAQKMEAIGRLAGGVAHDFNNLLTAIFGYVDLALEQIDADKPIWKDLREIQNAAQSAASLTQQLLAFGRKQLLHIEVLDLNDVVRSTEQMLRRTIGDDVRVEIKLAGSP